ncbi:SDR family NAD(P)-dependent oxidoreductase [Nitriliruptor alkaliphilus]|uniref:SDR family NAD(P)-dependent oxidoreductase n=1 Tax=Nitriliruptor alkaliphilus TaxID=427918 RepID=UPI000698498B|nr:SDR family NAD(P)-dependent oxidoreductase [Nitriliruptor alkaliphilus]
MAFHGRVALVTGGGSGMGQRACERLAARGHDVAAIDVDEAGLERTAASDPRIRTYVCDVTDTEGVEKVVAEVESDLGPVDRTIAAAAIMPSGLIADMDAATIRRVMDIDYGGVVNVVKATLPGMLERRTGDQIIFSSLMGHMPTMHLGAYCAAKFAVRAFTEILYHENRASGVRFACVCPPMVETPLLSQVTTDMKAMDAGAEPLTPDQVLDAIEADLDKGRFWVMPGQAKGASVAARLIPKLIWKNMHKIEGIA